MAKIKNVKQFKERVDAAFETQKTRDEAKATQARRAAWTCRSGGGGGGSSYPQPERLAPSG